MATVHMSNINPKTDASDRESIGTAIGDRTKAGSLKWTLTLALALVASGEEVCVKREYAM